MRGQKRRIKKLVRRQFTAVPKAMTGRRTFVAPDFPIPDVLWEVIAKGGPVEGFLLQAPLIRAQHPDNQWVVDAIPSRRINAGRDDSILCCK